jgi:hypothetical protein
MLFLPLNYYPMSVYFERPGSHPRVPRSCPLALAGGLGFVLLTPSTLVFYLYVTSLAWVLPIARFRAPPRASASSLVINALCVIPFVAPSRVVGNRAGPYWLPALRGAPSRW